MWRRRRRFPRTLTTAAGVTGVLLAMSARSWLDGVHGDDVALHTGDLASRWIVLGTDGQLLENVDPEPLRRRQEAAARERRRAAKAPASTRRATGGGGGPSGSLTSLWADRPKHSSSDRAEHPAHSEQAPPGDDVLAFFDDTEEEELSTATLTLTTSTATAVDSGDRRVPDVATMAAAISSDRGNRWQASVVDDKGNDDDDDDDDEAETETQETDDPHQSNGHSEATVSTTSTTTTTSIATPSKPSSSAFVGFETSSDFPTAAIADGTFSALFHEDLPGVEGSVLFAELSCLFVAFIGYLVYSIPLWPGFSRGQKCCLVVAFSSATLYQVAAVAWGLDLVSAEFMLGVSSLITRMISLGMVPITTTSFLGRTRAMAACAEAAAAAETSAVSSSGMRRGHRPPRARSS